MNEPTELPRIHQVSCSAHSEPEGSHFDEWERRSEQLARYARKLGFSVMYENADSAEPGDRHYVSEAPR